jgi:long-chain fatty acid transport protein
MNRFSLKLGIAAAALALAAPAAATNGMRMIGFGPVQNSMGGVSAATSLDATTAVTNPAGLCTASTRLDIAGTAFFPTVEAKTDFSMMGGPAASGESTANSFFIPTVGYLRPVNDKLTVGVTALGIAGLGVDYPDEIMLNAETMTSYSNMRLAPAVSYKVTDRLAVGVAANLMYAMMEYDVGGGFGMGMQPHDRAGAFGFGASLGVTFRPMDILTLGAAYETRSYFQDFEFELEGGTNKLEFDQPMVATVGAAVRPMAGLLVAADVQWINWSDTMGENLPEWTETEVGDAPWNMNWDNQLVFKIGAQYEVSKAFTVRAGYNYGKSPIDETLSLAGVAFPAISEHHFTAGAGYDVGAVTVNAAVLYSPEATAKYAGDASGNFPYETSMAQLGFDLGVAYRF